MNSQAYFADLTAQLRAVQNRVRHLIGNAHWPSDGAWKESALRSVIRGYLPSSMAVGIGFVLTPNGISSQIDVLIYDDSSPVLFRDGDFVVVPPDSVRAIIEVKTSVSASTLRPAIQKLSSISRLLREYCLLHRPFIGLFSYGSTSCPPRELLAMLKEENGQLSDYEISALSFGGNQFFRYWEFDPRIATLHSYHSWHAYDLPDVSPGYFIHNVVEHLFPQVVGRTSVLWYPIDGKEGHCVAEIKRHEG